MKKSFLVAFNKQLKELVDKLNIMIPNNEDLRLAKNMFHVPLMTKERIYIEQFYQHAKDYEVQIMNKNEEFFLNFDITEFFTVTSDVNEKHDDAKNIWGNFDPVSKNALWQYVQVLFKLSKKYYS